MTVREYTFTVGPETSTLPTIGTPSSDDDLITLGYADDRYTQGSEAVADVATLKAMAEAERRDGDLVLVLDANNLYRFDSASAAAGDDNFVLVPDVGSGRWIRVTILNRANTFTDTTDSSSKDTGSMILEGGLGVEKSVYIGGNLDVTGLYNNANLNEAVALTATSTELNHSVGVTSAIQTQIDSKQSDVITTRGDIVYGNASGVPTRLPLGGSGEVLRSDGTDIVWSTGASGDVTSASTITDNSIVRGDGGSKGVQQSGVLIDDSDNITGINDLTVDSLIKQPNSVHTVTNADYTITDTDGYSLILMSGGSVDRTVTLPLLANNQGRIITVKRIDAPTSGQASIIIDGNGSETLDGATTTKIGRRYGGQYTGKYASITLLAGPTEWHIIKTTNDIIYQDSTLAWSTSTQNANSVAVPAGTWQITVFSYKSAGSAGNNLSVGVSTTSASYDASPGYRTYTYPNSGFGTTSLTVVVKPTTETTYYHVFNTNSVTGGSTGNHMMVITRI